MNAEQVVALLNAFGLLGRQTHPEDLLFPGSADLTEDTRIVVKVIADDSKKTTRHADNQFR